MKNNLKPIIYIGGAVLMAYLIKKWFFDGKTSSSGALNTLTENEKELLELQKTYTASYSASNYESIANAIYESIRYSGLDDDYKNTFNELLKIKNPLDLALLIKAYDKRQRYKFGIPDGDAETLIPSVSKELRSEIIVNPFAKTKIEQINEVWQKRGIKTKL